MDNRIIQAIRSADNLVQNLLAVKAGEEVLIVVDPETDMRMPQAIAGAAERLGAEYSILVMPVRGQNNSTYISKTLQRAMEGCDVYIPMTRSSGAAAYNTTLPGLVASRSIRECCMVLRDLDNYISGGATADYEQVYADGLKLQAAWHHKKRAHVTTPAGTDLVFDMVDMVPVVECGICREPGGTMAFSDGEVSLGPAEDNMEGILVVDGPMACYGQPSRPLRMKIERGYVTELMDGDPKILVELEKLFAQVHNSNNIAEIGIGLNPASRFNGDFEEEKKARGTVHLALGNGGEYYGQPGKLSSIHYDMVLYNPTVVFDGQVFVDHGRLTILGE